MVVTEVDNRSGGALQMHSGTASLPSREEDDDVSASSVFIFLCFLFLI